MALLGHGARRRLYDFIYLVNPKYAANWHHKDICEEIDQFLESEEENRLMIFMPPQHGKSEITSRNLPAYYLGKNPDHDIVIASYSSDLANSFNSDAQRVINSEQYKSAFPKITLATEKGEECTLFGYSGSIKAVGVTGGLAGYSVDLAIIDDPVKDYIEASSPTYRERTWQWYLNVVETRLHNKSKVILVMTRWNEDDLAGRLLASEPEKWKVISIPAVKEDNSNPNDPRQIGEALWPEKHSLASLNDKRKKSETTFASLYQQRPAPAEGNKVKRDWWQYCNIKEVPGSVHWDLWIDGAYTKQTENDPTGLMVAGYHEQSRTLYIKHAHDAHLEMPELLKFIPEYADLHGLGYKSRAYLEPKASGKSLKQMIPTVSDLNAVEIVNHLVQEGKEARIQTASPKIEAGKVYLIAGTWNDRFVTQICTFPNATHDEYVDLIGYACFHYFDKGKRQGVTIRDFSQYRN